MGHSNQVNLLLVLLLLGFTACNNDDDIPADCPAIINEGLVSVQVADDKLPPAIFSRTESFRFVNQHSDTLVFEPETTIDFGLERIINMPCANGDSTAHFYQEQIKSKTFSSTTSVHAISFVASVQASNQSELDADNNLVIKYFDCFRESYSVSVRKELGGNDFSSISEFFNPNDCATFFGLGPTFETLQNVTLNNQNFTGDILKSNNDLNPSSTFILYYNQEAGVIGFEDENEVIWHLIE